MSDPEQTPLVDVLFGSRSDPRTPEPSLAEVISDWYRKNRQESSSARRRPPATLPTTAKDTNPR
jgi:hypothetical protein